MRSPLGTNTNHLVFVLLSILYIFTRFGRAGLAEALTANNRVRPSQPQQFVMDISPVMTDDTVVQLSVKCRSHNQIGFLFNDSIYGC